MKYVYAILTVIENNPIMQTYQSNVRLTGKEVLERVVFTEDEKRKYSDWTDEKEILKDMNNRQSIRVEIQEIEVK